MSTHPTIERFTVVQRVIERAQTIEPGADLPVSREEFATLMPPAVDRIGIPEGYDPYFFGRRLVVND